MIIMEYTNNKPRAPTIRTSNITSNNNNNNRSPRSNINSPGRQSLNVNTTSISRSSTPSYAFGGSSPRRSPVSPIATPHQYEPLRTASSVRLISLYPATSVHAVLRCSVCQIDVGSGNGGSDDAADAGEVPEYEALSYAWGTHEFSEQLLCTNIVVDGVREVYLPEGSSLSSGSKMGGRKEEGGGAGRNLVLEHSYVKITGALYEALRHLRRMHEKRLLWIDAICINQADDREKGHQVRQMSTIYKRAARVNIWLGKESLGSNETFQFLKDVANPWTVGRFGNIDDWVADLAPVVSGEKSSKSVGWSLLRDIFRRNYFTRRWVVQEVALSARAVVLCGDAEVSWEEFATALHSLVSGFTGLQREDHEVLTNIQMMDLIYRQHRSVLNTEPEDRFDILEILTSFDSFECADSRDRLFALLGLDDSSLAAYEPDYEKSATDAYVEFAKHCLQRPNGLDLLNCAGAHRDDSLPSWIPCWTVMARYKPFLHNDYFTAGFIEDESFEGLDMGDMQPTRPLAFHLEDNVLVLQGYIVDTVNSSRTQSFTGFRNPEQLRTNIDEWSDFLYSTIDSSATSPRHVDTNDDDLFWERLLVMLTINPPLPETERWAGQMHTWKFNVDPWARDERVQSVKTGFSQIRDRKIHLSTKSTEAWHFARFCSATMSGRCVFQTEQGRFGIAPFGTAEGDQVAVFLGARTPFIVRKVPGKDQQYKIIGDSFIDDLMDCRDIARTTLEHTSFRIV